jgi:hypothetical protein
MEKLKSKLEQVQRRAARYVTNRYHNTSSVSTMLNHLMSFEIVMPRYFAVVTDLRV